MEFPEKFICATEEYCDYNNHVPAPYFRKTFTIDEDITKAEILICGLGLYELYINGTNVTKGPLAPYFNSPDDILYYDNYDLSAYLVRGENVIGVVLGNGIQNSFGGSGWQFDRAMFRCAPKMALRLNVFYKDGQETVIEADESFKCAPSPILFDDLRCGEYYDARKEIPNWNKVGFDDSEWANAKRTNRSRGECRICNVEPIVISHELKPVSVTAVEGGYIYDFGVNCAGICRMTIDAKEGQEIITQHGEVLQDGKLFLEPFEHIPQDFVQKDIYYTKEGKQTHTPIFTYHGFQYVFVQGITKEQATKDLFTYLVMNSDLKERGNFECSNDVVNILQTLTRRSTLANFYYIPTDCPHREKNGWTADAALSVEHMLLNLTPENSLREWLFNIRKAMNDEGAIPGIIPTGGWGFEWGSGPAWDCVLTYLPYYIYRYRGDKNILEENATAIFRYLNYLTTRINEDGLIKWGLGDWCPTGRFAMDYKCPLEFSDTVMSMDISRKAANIYDVLDLPLQKEFAQGLYLKLRTTIRKKLIDFSTMTAYGNCQTSQAMAIYYDVFEEGEKPKAYEKLLELIHRADDFMDLGVLGARVIFHVLSDHGDVDLALKMIIRPEFPSYGNWIKRGATALWEEFQPEGGKITSRNHHFWGFISGWFIRAIAGINLNPFGDNVNEVLIAPKFASELDHTKAYHIAPLGKIEVEWNRTGEDLELTVKVPEGMSGRIVLDNRYMFENEVYVNDVKSGTYKIRKRK